MMRMKRIAAALLAVLMALTLMSGITINASATNLNELGGPAKIEAVEIGADNGSGGLIVSGLDLDSDVLVVNKSWQGKTGRVAIKLNDVVYQATMGVNAFAEVADAIAKAENTYTIYVAPGTYTKAATIYATSLNLYGPYAGVNPNDPADISLPNPARPGADGSDLQNEAVLTPTFTINAAASNLRVEGFTFTGSFNLKDALNGGLYRTGTTICNNIVNVTSKYIFDTDPGLSPGILVENNRILSCNTVVRVGGMAGLKLLNNYIRNNDYSVIVTSVVDGSMGQYCLVEGNYYPKTNGLVRVYTGTNTLYYSLQVKNNTVMEGSANPMVLNNYYDQRTVGGTNVIVEGNKFYKLHAAPFQLPRHKDDGVLTKYVFSVKINQNYFELPEGVNLIESTAEAQYELPDLALDVTKNYYTTPMDASRIPMSEGSTLFLYPMYQDPGMTRLTGTAQVTAVSNDLKDVTKIDQNEKVILVDLRGKGINQLDMTGKLVVESDREWKLFADATLTEEIPDKTVYFDGEETVRYVSVADANGALSKETYALKFLNDRGTKAELLGIVADAMLPDPVISGQTFTYNLDNNVAFLNFELKLSTGAKAELFDDKDCTVPMKDLGGYIPYGGYTVYAKVTSQGTAADPAYAIPYTIVFNRGKSEYYDPCILQGILPKANLRVNPIKKVIDYDCGTLLGEETFDFKTTPGATYRIFSEDGSKELSSSANIRKIALKPGNNVFQVRVTAGVGENVYKMNVRNDALSADNTILSLTGTTGAVVDREITAASNAAAVTLTFNTRNVYAKCKVYADKEKKVEVPYSSFPQKEEGSIHEIDKRSFKLATEFATNRYYVVCTAENGASRDYELVITRTIASKTYSDVKKDAWYAPYVEAATSKGYIAGSPKDDAYLFNGADKMTREQLGIIMCRVLGYNADAFEKVSVPFADAASISGWALNHAKVCYHFGIIKGAAKGDGKLYYNPKASVTRQEVMVIFARTLKLSGSYNLASFKDGGKVASWAKADVQAVVASGLIKGDEKGNLNPTKSITRAEIAAILARI